MLVQAQSCGGGWVVQAGWPWAQVLSSAGRAQLVQVHAQEAVDQLCVRPAKDRRQQRGCAGLCASTYRLPTADSLPRSIPMRPFISSALLLFTYGMSSYI